MPGPTWPVAACMPSASLARKEGFALLNLILASDLQEPAPSDAGSLGGCNNQFRGSLAAAAR